MQSPDALEPLPADVLAALEDGLDNFHTAMQPLGQGYQASTWLFRYQDTRLVIKSVPPRSLWKPLLAFTLRHEFRVYRKLAGIDGIPKCYGLFRGRFLVLEYIDGSTLRHARLSDRDYFFAKMFGIIQAMHRRGVAHIDLKRKDNILVVDDKEPYFIDFGVAMVRRQHFRPINNYLMHLAERFDYNAWIKHKYQRQYQNITEEDRPYLRRTLIERVARAVKQTCKRMLRI